MLRGEAGSLGAVPRKYGDLSRQGAHQDRVLDKTGYLSKQGARRNRVLVENRVLNLSQEGSSR